MESTHSFPERMQEGCREGQFARFLPQSRFEGDLVKCKQPYIPNKSRVECIPSPLVHPSLPKTVLAPEYSRVLTKKQSKVYADLQVSLQECSDIEKATREQSRSPTWQKMREGRLTASSFKSVCSRRGNFETFGESAEEENTTDSCYGVWPGA